MNHPAHITPLGLLERRLPHLAECRPPLHLAHRKLGTVSLKRISLLPPLNCEREISAFGPAIFVLEIAIGGKHNRKELLNRPQRYVCGEEGLPDSGRGIRIVSVQLRGRKALLYIYMSVPSDGR